MNPSDYLPKAVRNADNYENVNKRLTDNLFLQKLNHGALGISGEAGEVTDLIKKVVIQGKPLDVDKLKKELGDVLFYTAVLIEAIDSSFEEIMQINSIKLDARFPNGFTEAAALERRDEK